MGEIVLERVWKVYGKDPRPAVNDLSLNVGDGELLVIVGPSGCGKTSALRMVAGLEDVTDGTISVGGRVVNNVRPRDRDIAMVFQDYALYPQLTAAQNMAFGLRARKTPRDEIRRAVRDAARILDLEDVLDRKPGQLSGGQRQRVAMGRAIVRRPAAFLMDEPLSNLDAQLRVQMRAEIARIQSELNVTTLYVTHDQVEAVTLGHRVAVMRGGILQQVATPKALYESPRSVFVASFIGSPSMNFLYGMVEFEDDRAWLRVGNSRLRLNREALARWPALPQRSGSEVVVGIRPEDLLDVSVDESTDSSQRLRAEVTLVEELGNEVLVYFNADARALAPDRDATGMEGLAARCVARFGRASKVCAGEVIEIGVDTTRLHFFDSETLLAIPEPRFDAVAVPR